MQVPLLPEPSYILFAQNKGQWNNSVLYEGNFKGGKVFLEKQGFSYLFYPKDGFESFHHRNNSASDTSLTFHAVKMNFVNCNLNSTIQQREANSFFTNYFRGKNPSKWASGVKSYKQIIYHDLYPGIDMKSGSDKNNFRFDFVVNPGADVGTLAMDFKGQDHLHIINGDLVFGTAVGRVLQKAPYAYQIINDRKIKVKCEYILEAQLVKFKVGDYNNGLPLIIDPTLVFATYTGSLSDNFGMTATYDVQGNAYTAGICFGPDYPVTTGAFQVSFNALQDISISKFNPTGSSLLYSTYLGGGVSESPQSIVVDNLGQLVVFGRTSSVDFPTTSTIFQSSNAGGFDLIITKFNTTGTGLVASTYFGGTANDGVNGFFTPLDYNYSDDLRGSVIVDDSNYVYIGASTVSSDFPVTSGCYQSTLNGTQDACIIKFDPGLTAPIYSSYFGGGSYDGIYNIALDNQNRMYVTGGTNSTTLPTTTGCLHASNQGGIDGFISLFSFNGNSLVASTYIGTASYDQSYFIQIDKQNRVYVFGQTEGAYPITAGTYSNTNSGQFIHCLNAGLTSTFFSTVVGSGDGFPDIVPSAFMVDVCGSIYLSGWGGFGNTISTTGLPVSSNAFLNVTDGRDFYFMVLDKDALSLQYATFFGGNQSMEHVDGGTSRFDKSGIIYQAICESCGGHDDMPTTPTAWSTVNGSSNCNNAVVKFTFNSNLVAAQLSVSNPSGCLPYSVSFANNSANGIDYVWDFGDGTNSTAFAPAHTYTAVGVYTVQLISHNAATCNVYDTTFTTITVLPLVALNPFSAPQTGCSPFAVNFTNNNNTAASVYYWNFGDGTSVTSYSASHTYSAIGVYTVQLISQNNGSCKVYDTTYTTVSVVPILPLFPIPLVQNGCAPMPVSFSNLNSSTGLSYSWNFGDGTAVSTAFAPAHTYSTAGVYTVQLISQSSNACNISDTIYTTVTVMPPLTITHLPTQNMCVGDSLQLNLGAPAGCSFTWTPASYLNNASIQQPNTSPPADLLYHVSVEKGGCVKYDSAQIFVFKNDTKIVLDPTHACIDDTVKLFANQICASYFWSSGQTTPSINAFNPGWYYLTTISNNCLYKDSIRVDSFAHVPMTTYSVSLCLYDRKQLIGPSGNYVYDWTPPNEIDHTDIYNPFVYPKSNLTYTLSVYNGPCVTTGTYDVKVHALPTLTVTPKKIEVFSGEVVQMNSLSDTTCKWEPDYMLSCTFCNSAAAIVPVGITYYATVSNEYGCLAKDSVVIKVTPTLYIPNTFSPNNDLLNDVFKPEYTGFVEIELMIFDRWGANIFSTNDLNGGWNGTYKNVNCELGVYTYKLSAKDISGKTLEKVGHVTLLR